MFFVNLLLSSLVTVWRDDPQQHIPSDKVTFSASLKRLRQRPYQKAVHSSPQTQCLLLSLPFAPSPSLQPLTFYELHNGHDQWPGQGITTCGVNDRFYVFETVFLQLLKGLSGTLHSFSRCQKVVRTSKSILIEFLVETCTFIRFVLYELDPGDFATDFKDWWVKKRRKCVYYIMFLSFTIVFTATPLQDVFKAVSIWILWKTEINWTVYLTGVGTLTQHSRENSCYSQDINNNHWNNK